MILNCSTVEWSSPRGYTVRFSDAGGLGKEAEAERASETGSDVDEGFHTGSTSQVAKGWLGVVSDAVHTAVCLRSLVHRPSLLPGKPRTYRSTGWPASIPDACRGYCRFSCSNDPSRPARTAPHADRRRDSHVGSWHRVRIDKEASLPLPRRHYRRDQSERPRSGTFPIDRAVGVVARGSGAEPHGSVRLVHAGRFSCDGTRRPRWWCGSGTCTASLSFKFRQLPHGSASLRGSRSHTRVS